MPLLLTLLTALETAAAIVVPRPFVSITMAVVMAHLCIARVPAGYWS